MQTDFTEVPTEATDPKGSRKGAANLAVAKNQWPRHVQPSSQTSGATGVSHFLLLLRLVQHSFAEIEERRVVLPLLSEGWPRCNQSNTQMPVQGQLLQPAHGDCPKTNDLHGLETVACQDKTSGCIAFFVTLFMSVNPSRCS